MPPRCKFTREEIVLAAVEITRESGIRAVTARAVGNRLHSSSKVIFGFFHTMEELQSEVIKKAEETYRSYLLRGMSDPALPPYKGSGMAYIRFAQEERELFRLLFMRDRSGEAVSEDAEELRRMIGMIQESTGLGEQDAYLFHLEMWICVHGIATMLATKYLRWDWEWISRMMTDLFEGLKERYKACGKMK